MGLFRRRSSSASSAAEAISGFWQWWPAIRERLAAAGSAPDDALAGELAGQVARLHPDLAWEVSVPSEGRPALTLSGGGRDDLRAITERWMRAAPDDDTWEFRPAVAADPEALDSVFRLDEHELELSHVALGVRVDAGKARVNTSVYHPDFLFLPEDAQAITARRALTLALGEDEVSRWIGDVTPVEEKPVDALGLSALPAVTRQLAESRDDWLTGETRTPRGRPALVRVRFPLRRVDHPLCDTHVLVSVPYAHAGPDRLPVDPSAAALSEFGAKLESLGGGAAMLAAYETGDDHRVFHVYADSESGALGEIDQLAAGWQEGKVRVVSRADPEWQALGPYRM